ncbi:hypothetical protein E2562_015722 [Oryza meyeriana var. granulata]|uniref:Uncharacterized protein n=1 Tax=Oryza meyeriana var. granulata TaxID=110450 RepID=A0A6G1D2Z2_9ORYZ|nr:hypothetical protein E2562_015722 [Oryza meyeriana var. granulata]
MSSHFFEQYSTSSLKKMPSDAPGKLVNSYDLEQSRAKNSILPSRAAVTCGSTNMPGAEHSEAAGAVAVEAIVSNDHEQIISGMYQVSSTNVLVLAILVSHTERDCIHLNT